MISEVRSASLGIGDAANGYDPSSGPVSREVSQGLPLSSSLAVVFKRSFETLSHAYKSGTAVMIHDLISNTAEATKTIHQNTRLIETLGTSGKALSIASAPLAFQGIYNGFNRILTKDDRSNRTDGALNVVKCLGSVSKVAAKVIKVVNQFGWISMRSLKWASNLTIIGTALSVAGLVSVAKNWIDATGFRKKHFDGKLDYSVAVNELLANRGNGLRRQLQIKRALLNEKIREIRQNAQKGVEIDKQIFEALKGRIESRLNSHRLAFLSAAVSLAAGSILIATPGAPLLYGALALGSFITANKLVSERNGDREFRRSFNL